MAEEIKRWAVRSTATNPQTGESETWEDTGENKTPVSKTLPNVTVGTTEMAEDATERQTGDVERKPRPRRRWAAKGGLKVAEEGAEAVARRLGPVLEKYGDDHQDIWQRGNRRRVER